MTQFSRQEIGAGELRGERAIRWRSRASPEGCVPKLGLGTRLNEVAKIMLKAGCAALSRPTGYKILLFEVNIYVNIST